MLKVYQSNALLRYQEFVYLLKIAENKYLVIGMNLWHDYDYPPYKLGDLDEEFEEFDLEPTDFTIEKSPLFGTFLFDFFISNFH